MNNSEELLARLLNHLADKFKNQLILKGGILLRLQGSARLTQDLDYVWIRTKKRNLFAEEIKTSLQTLEGIEIKDLQVNSRGIFIQVFDQPSQTTGKIEISVVEATSLPPQALTNFRLVKPYGLKTQVVAAMDLSEAFSHKIAAALERDLVRDLYDINQWEALTSFDEKTLKERLTRLEIGRSKPKQVSWREAIRLLKEKMENLSEKDLLDQLEEWVPSEELPGLTLIIRAALSRVIQRLTVLAQKEDPTPGGDSPAPTSLKPKKKPNRPGKR